ncbi:uncharacterized protein LOC110858983 isoform X2 [Folsomia candida]|nr:uncharacterized protein LOC110858983 isoform X2 [Folsomia candida]
MEAFPFLCAQVGVSPTRAATTTGGRQAPAALCSTCHALWEEVTLLYANMQGILNLMGRRVTSLKQRAKGGCKNDRQTRQKEKQGRIRAASPSRPEVMMNWWYPQASQPAGNNNHTQIHHNSVAPTIEESNPDVKLECDDDIDCLDLGEDMDLEDVEIMPDPRHQNDDDDDDGDDLNDPNYDPRGDDEASNSRSEAGKSKTTPRQQLTPQDYPPIETLVSEKGRPMVLMNDFLYNFRSTSATLGKSVWECKAKKCGVRLHTTDDPVNPKFFYEVNSHNHTPIEGGVLMKKVMSKIRMAALTTTDSPQEIIAQFRAELDAAYKKNGRKVMTENIRRNIRRIRKDRDNNVTVEGSMIS